MRKSIVLCVLMGVAGTAIEASAETLRVPSDDHPTIQSAVDAAGPNDKIVIRRGTYAENVVVRLKSGLTLIGKGRPTITPANTGDGLTLDECDQVTVKGIDVDGVIGHGIVVSDSRDVRVTRCRVSNVSLDGVRADDCDRATIDRNLVSVVGDTGISLSGDSQTLTTDDSIVRRNRISDCGDYGVLVNGDRNEVSRNRTTDTSEEGFIVEGIAPTDNLVERNTAIDAGDDGFELNGLRNRCIRNRAIRSLCDGFDLETDATECVLERNLALDCEYGIDVEGSGNFIRLNRVVRATNEAANVSGSDNEFFRNRFDRTGNDGFDIEGDRNLFERNTVLRSGDDGIDLLGTGNRLTRNRVLKSGGFDLVDAAPGQNTIEDDNRFGTVDEGGG